MLKMSKMSQNQTKFFAQMFGSDKIFRSKTRCFNDVFFPWCHHLTSLRIVQSCKSKVLVVVEILGGIPPKKYYWEVKPVQSYFDLISASACGYLRISCESWGAFLKYCWLHRFLLSWTGFFSSSVCGYLWVLQTIMTFYKQ